MGPKKRPRRRRKEPMSPEEEPLASPSEGPTGLDPPSTSSFVPFSGTGHRLGGPVSDGIETTSNSRPRASVSSTNLSSFGGPTQAKRPKASKDAKPVDREPLVYHLDTRDNTNRDDEELPDSFYQVTVDDVRTRFAQLQNDRKALEDAPLLTAALQESHMIQRMQRYPKVVVRIQFPDRHVLQGFFRPMETVGNLRQFVKNHLASPELQFYLFTAPPKTSLDDPNTTLFEANLFPAALVYFHSDVKTGCQLPPREQIMDSRVSSTLNVLHAEEAVTGCMPRSLTLSSTSLVPEESFPPPAASKAPANRQGTAADQPQPQTNSQAPKPVRSDPSRVPKWPKLPGEK